MIRWWPVGLVLLTLSCTGGLLDTEAPVTPRTLDSITTEGAYPLDAVNGTLVGSSGKLAYVRTCRGGAVPESVYVGSPGELIIETSPQGVRSFTAWALFSTRCEGSVGMLNRGAQGSWMPKGVRGDTVQFSTTPSATITSLATFSGRAKASGQRRRLTAIGDTLPIADTLTVDLILDGQTFTLRYAKP